MELTELEPDREILQHNAISSGRFDYTAVQLDILFMTSAKLETKDQASINKPYSIHLKDIEAITGRKWNYQQLQEATRDLGGRMFQITTEKSLKQIWLFQSVEYHTGKGYFDVVLSEAAKPYLFNLKNNFTVLQLKSALSCSSKYAKRLYAICCQWRTKGNKILEIAELKEMLFLKDPKGKEKEQFERISDFKKYVLDVAREQINAHTDIRFDYELLKRGKAFDRIRIYVNLQAPKQIEIDFNASLEFQKNVSAVKAYGFQDDLADRIAKYHMDDFNEAVAEVKRRMLAGEAIHKPAAYIATILQNKKLI